MRTLVSYEHVPLDGDEREFVERIGVFPWSPASNVNLERPSECVICGSSEFVTGERLAVLMNPRFTNGAEHLRPVWLHRQCFEAYPASSDELDPVPW